MEWIVVSNPLRKPVTVHRTEPGQFVDGIWVEGAPSSFTIRASVHPAEGKDLEVLPEGKRSRGAYRLVTDAELFELEEGSRNADQVELFGERYEVTRKQAWQNGVLPNFQYLVTKVN